MARRMMCSLCQSPSSPRFASRFISRSPQTGHVACSARPNHWNQISARGLRDIYIDQCIFCVVPFSDGDSRSKNFICQLQSLHYHHSSPILSSLLNSEIIMIAIASSSSSSTSISISHSFSSFSSSHSDSLHLGRLPFYLRLASLFRPSSECTNDLSLGTFCRDPVDVP